MINLIGGIWDNFVNFIREMDPTVRYSILGVLLFCVFACLALAINKKDDKHDKEPIKWRYLIIAVILMAIMLIIGVFVDG